MEWNDTKCYNKIIEILNFNSPNISSKSCSLMKIFSNNQTLRPYHSGKNTHQKKNTHTHTKINGRLIKIKIKVLVTKSNWKKLTKENWNQKGKSNGAKSKDIYFQLGGLKRGGFTFHLKQLENQTKCVIHSFKHCMTGKHRRWILEFSQLKNFQAAAQGGDPKENPMPSLSYWNYAGLGKKKQVSMWGGLIPKKELDRERAPSRDHQRIPKDWDTICG